jgi:hypothetical protein
MAEIMLIALLSTLISSVALAGVAISLLLQARQLRTSQLQATRTTQLELMKMALDNPDIAAAALGYGDPETLVKRVFMNWHFQFLQFGFENNTISALSLRFSIAELFETEDTRNWWLWARRSYEIAATTRREKEFFAIADQEFQRASQTSAPSESAPTSSKGPVTSPPPSS